MRTFHTGGVASAADITQGLPRVEELFEARKPKGLAVISEIDGTVSINIENRKREVIITSDEGEEQKYNIVYGAIIKVKEGQRVEAGDELTSGSVYPQDLLRIKGVKGVQNYIIKEVQRVYRLQGVDINDKHIEIIVRQMLSNIKIDDSGDTDLLPGSFVKVVNFKEANKKAREEGKTEATGTPALMGITKASLETESFLSAASFQETTKVLTDAAIKGKVDTLSGLKENVIIGQLIPAGTGVRSNRRIKLKDSETGEILESVRLTEEPVEEANV